MTFTLTLTDELRLHLRTLLFEDLHQWVERLAAAAHSAHEGPSAGAGDDAQSAWRGSGIQQTAALLDLVGWDTSEDAARLRAVRSA